MQTIDFNSGVLEQYNSEPFDFDKTGLNNSESDIRSAWKPQES